jgi:hypothetical protein
MATVTDENADEAARSTWRGRVLNEAERLESQLAACADDAGRAAVEPAVRASIERARAAALTRKRQLRDWFTGVSFDKAWSALQEADELLTQCLPSPELRAATADLLADLEARLTPGDTRLQKYREELETCGKSSDADLTPGELATIRAARHTANTAAYVAQGVVRRWRNLLFAVGAAVLAVAVALAIIAAAVHDFLPLEDGHGGANQVWQIELMGAFGGAIGAVLAVNRFSGYTDPNGLPLYQALLRIPMAAAVSLLGVILLQSKVLDALQPQQADIVLAYAVLFGYAQEPLLRTIDRKAGEVLGPARGKDDPLGKQTATGEK